MYFRRSVETAWSILINEVSVGRLCDVGGVHLDSFSIYEIGFVFLRKTLFSST